MENIPKILHISTHNEPCGIGKFQEKCVAELNENGGSQNIFYPISPNKIKKLNDKDRKLELENIAKTASEYDVVHIQHEFGFFYKAGLGFGEIIDVLENTGVRIVVTIHTAPELLLLPETLNSKSIRGIAGYMYRKYKNNWTVKNKFIPFSKVDKIITFNEFTRAQLVSVAGVSSENIFKTMLPVPSTNTKDNHRIRELINAQKGDAILCAAGFLNEYKGFDQAIKTLKFLPKNYRLAILGGTNPNSGNPKIYDGLCDLIISLGLEDRVYISGYIDTDEELSVLMQGCDIALYPYSVEYYKMASSDAINKAISCRVPIVAYPTESFKEINNAKQKVLLLTQSPNYYELAKEVKNIDKEELVSNEDEYEKTYNYPQIAADITQIYNEILKS